MHIPDGYLSPQTCATFGAAMVPAWYTAGRRVRKIVKSRYVPLLALGSAYCFLVMMFNVPVPDGTTAHAVGAVLVAVLLGPWAAVIAVSTALLIQALFFGDGGVLAYATNCFNMALVMPMLGYFVYRLLTRNVSLTSRRRALAAGIGAYVGLNAAALCTAIEFGVQPDLFKDANGAPLYAPFHLAQTIPTMLAAHLLVAGVVEAVLTVGVITYLQRANVPVLRINHPDVPDDQRNDDQPQDEIALVSGGRRPRWRWAGIGLAAMMILTPLGLLASGTAFGEDAPESAGFWHHALFDGYDFTGGRHPNVGYVTSALVGTLVIALLLLGSVKIAQAVRRSRREAVRA
jgi:cobalt/nickel transport system permease protein